MRCCLKCGSEYGRDEWQDLALLAAPEYYEADEHGPAALLETRQCAHCNNALPSDLLGEHKELSA